MTDFSNAANASAHPGEEAYEVAAGGAPEADYRNEVAPVESESEGDSKNEKTALALMSLLIVLAVASSVVMLFASSTGWMKIAVLLALWAAVLGAMLVSRYRKTISANRQRLADLEQLRQVELDRELATHREQELILEQNYLDSLEGSKDDAIAALRAEIFALREQLAEFMGDDFDQEQVALRARAERVRELESSYQASPLKDPVGNDRPEPRASAHRAEMTANGTVGAHTQFGAAPVEEAETTEMRSQSTPWGQPVDVTEVASSERPGRTGRRFATDSFQAINWAPNAAGAGAGAAGGAAAGESAASETGAAHAAQALAQQRYGAHGASGASGARGAHAGMETSEERQEADQPTRILSALAEDTDTAEESTSRHGRRRAEDQSNGLTVAELMAQMRRR